MDANSSGSDAESKIALWQWRNRMTNTLEAAIVAGDHAEIRRLRDDVIGPWKDWFRHSIFLAAVRNDVSTMELLVEMGDDVNALDHTGNTALYEAIRRGHLESMDFLLQHGADAHVFGPDEMDASFAVPGKPLLHRVTATCCLASEQSQGIYSTLALLFDKRPNLLKEWLDFLHSFESPTPQKDAVKHRISEALQHRNRGDLSAQID